MLKNILPLNSIVNVSKFSELDLEVTVRYPGLLQADAGGFGEGFFGTLAKKHRENCKTLPGEHLVGCQGVKLFILKYVTITTVTITTGTTDTITTFIYVTITTFITNTTFTITTVTSTTVTFTTVTIIFF